MLEWIEAALGQRGIDLGLAVMAVQLVFIAALAGLVHFVFRVPILHLAHRLMASANTEWDAIIARHQVFRRLAGLPALIVIYVLVPVALGQRPRAVAITEGALEILLTVVLVLLLDAVLDAALEIYELFEVAREKPLKGFVQVLTIVVYGVGAIFVVSILVGKSPVYLLSGLTALTAILLLVFRDAILGFVAGIQLTANKLVATGDWIEMPKYEADGTVMDVALSTVTVQNWDKTFTTVPTYALISESFRNWRGMAESGGRRIKRSIFIDVNTVRFCDEEMLQRFAKIQYIRQYLDDKKAELERFNTERKVDDASLVNGRRLTNVGTFRAYVEAYLRDHPMIHQEMTFLVRHLQPGDNGLPIEIYVFCNDIVWTHYEAVQADIFDHILAVVPEFDLRVFQRPAGRDFQEVLQRGGEN